MSVAPKGRKEIFSMPRNRTKVRLVLQQVDDGSPNKRRGCHTRGTLYDGNGGKRSNDVSKQTDMICSSITIVVPHKEGHCYLRFLPMKAPAVAHP